VVNTQLTFVCGALLLGGLACILACIFSNEGRGQQEVVEVRPSLSGNCASEDLFLRARGSGKNARQPSPVTGRCLLGLVLLAVGSSVTSESESLITARAVASSGL
jgi:hypothetical protein